eukprot:SAG11_NODE_370_length_10058_cov_108.790943_4_plen_51_part_00
MAGGGAGRLVELGNTLVEEAAGGATSEELLLYVWTVAGEPSDEDMVGPEA